MKQEREQWLQLQKECEMIKDKLEGHISESEYLSLKSDYDAIIQENKQLALALKEDTNELGLSNQMEVLQKTNQLLEQQIADVKSEFFKYKQYSNIEFEQLRDDYEALSEEYNSLKDKYSLELKGFDNKYTQFYEEKDLSLTCNMKKKKMRKKTPLRQKKRLNK